jgi:hypothetical protein
MLPTAKNLWPSCARHHWQAVGVFTADGWSWYLLSKSSSADLFPGTGENPSQAFYSTGNNQPLRRRGVLKSEDTPCPNSGHVPKQDTCPESGLAGAHDMPGSKASGTAGRRGLHI